MSAAFGGDALTCWLTGEAAGLRRHKQHRALHKTHFIEREAAGGRKDVDGIPDAIPSSVTNIRRPPKRSSESMACGRQRPPQTQQEAGVRGPFEGPHRPGKSRPTVHCAVCQYKLQHFLKKDNKSHTLSHASFIMS